MRFASKGSPRHQMERSSSSKVCQLKHTQLTLVSVCSGASRAFRGIIYNIEADVLKPTLLLLKTFLWSCPPGWPRMKWVVTDTKYLTKPSKDWQPHIPTANTDTAYIEVFPLRYTYCITTSILGVSQSYSTCTVHS